MSSKWVRHWPKSHRIPRPSIISYLAGLFLMVLWLGLHSSTLAQTTSLPSPSPDVAHKKSVKDKTDEIPTGSIKGRVIADDGRVVSNAVVVASAFSTPLVMKSA